jgi:hypothetical protein
MATEINRAPVLTGKAAQDFRQKVNNFSAKENKAEIIKGLRRYREFMSKQRHFQQYV